MRRGAVLALALALAGCGPAPRPVGPSRVEVEPLPSALPAPAPAEAPDAASRAKVRAMLARVSRARGLPVRREVESKVLTREQILARVRAHVEKEIPREVAAHEGELLAALELLPPEYDYLEGVFRLLQGRIAGFYEPSDATMYLVEDLREDEVTETLAHELAHALQDQAYRLGSLLEFAPGDGDRTAAAHALAEGDAMSVMLDVTLGSAFNISEAALRRVLTLSNAASEAGSQAPRALAESLIVPYADGFSFVQRCRERGGWAAVDAVWRALPASTEQLLHPEKYQAREPPIQVGVPPFATLGPGFRAVIHDVMGEQGLRIMLAEWTTHERAAKGAAGWGGDRYVVLRSDDPAAPGQHTLAVGWRAVFDTDRDAAEVADILKARFGARCRERPTVGPLSWQRSGRDVVIAAGPYERRGMKPKAAGSCTTARRWAAELMKAR